jgi:hypothetical protein|nr:MAG TPA: hypothetical protein [Caudoviricetes sp.]
MAEVEVSKEYLRGKIKELIDGISSNSIELNDTFLSEYNEKYVELVKEWIFTTVPYAPPSSELFHDISSEGFIQSPDPFLGFAIIIKKGDPLYDYDLSYDSIKHAFDTNNTQIVNELNKRYIFYQNGIIVLGNRPWEKIPLFDYDVYTLDGNSMIRYKKRPVFIGPLIKGKLFSGAPRPAYIKTFDQLTDAEKESKFSNDGNRNRYYFVSQKKCPSDEMATSYKVMGWTDNGRSPGGDPLFPWVHSYPDTWNRRFTYPAQIFFKYPPTIKNSISRIIDTLRDPNNSFSRQSCFDTLNKIIDNSISEDMNVNDFLKTLIDLFGGIRRAKINRIVSFSVGKRRGSGPMNIDFSQHTPSQIDFNNTAIFNLNRRYKEEIKHLLGNFDHDQELIKKEDIDQKFNEIYNIWTMLPVVELNVDSACVFQSCSHTW